MLTKTGTFVCSLRVLAIIRTVEALGTVGTRVEQRNRRGLRVQLAQMQLRLRRIVTVLVAVALTTHNAGGQHVTMRSLPLVRGTPLRALSLLSTTHSSRNFALTQPVNMLQERAMEA